MARDRKQSMENDQVNFSVDGEGLTDIVRGLYIDGKQERALSILYHVNGLPVAEAYKILEGKRKLVSTPEGGVTIVDDNVDVKPTPIYAPPVPVLHAEYDFDDVERAPEPPAPDATLKTDTGWLLPDGKLYACRYREHERLAWQLGAGDRYHMFFGVPGWLHLEDGTWRVPNALRHEGVEPTVVTQAQIDTIFDWCQVHEKELPDWLGRVATE